MSATTGDIRDRILVLTKAYTDAIGVAVMGTDISHGATLLQLPAYTCVAGPATWRKQSARRFLVDRTYELWVYVTLIAKLDNEDVIRAAINDCDPLIAALAAYFSELPRLEFHDAGIVHDTQDIGDSGPAQTPLRNSVYSGFRLLIPTTVYAP